MPTTPLRLSLEEFDAGLNRVRLQQIREELIECKKQVQESKEQSAKLKEQLQEVKRDFVSHQERVERTAESLRVRGEVIAKLERSYAELGIKMK